MTINITLTGVRKAPSWERLQDVICDAVNEPDGKLIKIDRDDKGVDYSAPGAYKIVFRCPGPDGEIDVPVELSVNRQGASETCTKPAYKFAKMIAALQEVQTTLTALTAYRDGEPIPQGSLEKLKNDVVDPVISVVLGWPDGAATQDDERLQPKLDGYRGPVRTNHCGDLVPDEGQSNAIYRQDSGGTVKVQASEYQDRVDAVVARSYEQGSKRPYTGLLDPGKQVEVEEAIAKALFDRMHPLTEVSNIEEDCQELSREILHDVLSQFRKDLVVQEDTRTSMEILASLQVGDVVYDLPDFKDLSVLGSDAKISDDVTLLGPGSDRYLNGLLQHRVPTARHAAYRDSTYIVTAKSMYHGTLQVAASFGNRQLRVMTIRMKSKDETTPPTKPD